MADDGRQMWKKGTKRFIKRAELYEETESDETLKKKKDDLQVFGQTKPPFMGHRVLLQCIVTFAKI